MAKKNLTVAAVGAVVDGKVVQKAKALKFDRNVLFAEQGLLKGKEMENYTVSSDIKRRAIEALIEEASPEVLAQFQLTAKRINKGTSALISYDVTPHAKSNAVISAAKEIRGEETYTVIHMKHEGLKHEDGTRLTQLELAGHIVFLIVAPYLTARGMNGLMIPESKTTSARYNPGAAAIGEYFGMVFEARTKGANFDKIRAGTEAERAEWAELLPEYIDLADFISTRPAFAEIYEHYLAIEAIAEATKTEEQVEKEEADQRERASKKAESAIYITHNHLDNGATTYEAKMTHDHADYLHSLGVNIQKKEAPAKK